MTKYQITNKAIIDLEDIWNYTFETWSERQADLYYEMRKLSSRPQSLSRGIFIPKWSSILKRHFRKCPKKIVSGLVISIVA